MWNDIKRLLRFWNSDSLNFPEAIYLSVLAGMQDQDNIIPNSSPFSGLLHSISKVEAICRRAKPYLRSLTYCVTTEHTKEHYAFQLYTNYLIAIICQEVLQKAAKSNGKPNQVQILSIARRALVTAAKSFLYLHRLSIIPLRTWSYLHCGIGTALLLGISAQLEGTEEVLSLLRALVDILPDPRVSSEPASLSLQHQRALTVLKMRHQGTSAQSASKDRSRPASPPVHVDEGVENNNTYQADVNVLELDGGWYAEK